MSPAIRKPNGLAPGATVRLVCPASPPRDLEAWQRAERQIGDLGFVPQLGPVAGSLRAGGLRAGPERRARELEDALLDPGVGAVWAVRGGYGCLPLLECLAFERLAQASKPLLGFSDLTVVLLALHRLTGLVSFHAPMPAREIPPWSREQLLTMLSTAASGTELGTGAPGGGRLRTLVGGQAEGFLLPANLSLLARLCGTPFAPDLAGAILCLEDVGEEPYRVHGLLTQLRLTGALARVAGIVLGSFDERTTAEDNGFRAVFEDRLADLGVPVICGFPMGHVSEQATLPVGVRATLDASRPALRLLEAPVVA